MEKEKTAVLYKYAYLAAAYNKREKKENWDDWEESGFRAYSRSSPIGFTEFSFIYGWYIWVNNNI